jgi:hypothetical protein
LQNNDVIELGKYKLKYISEALPGAAKAADFEKTMILRPGAMRKPPEPQPHVTASPSPAHTETAPGIAAPPAAAAPIPAAPAARAHGDTQIGMAEPVAPAAPAPAAPVRRAMLQLLSGANAGKELELTKPLTTLGKPGVQVAVITRRPQGFFITHVEGANKPTVNGTPIAQQAHVLNDHDIIELAGVKVEFFYKT